MHARHAAATHMHASVCLNPQETYIFRQISKYIRPLNKKSNPF